MAFRVDEAAAMAITRRHLPLDRTWDVPAAGPRWPGFPRDRGFAKLAGAELLQQGIDGELENCLQVAAREAMAEQGLGL